MTSKFDCLREKCHDNYRNIEEDRSSQAAILCKFIHSLKMYLGMDNESSHLRVGDSITGYYDLPIVKEAMMYAKLSEGWTLKINLCIFQNDESPYLIISDYNIPILVNIYRCPSGYMFMIKDECFTVVDDFYDDICKYVYSTVHDALKANPRGHSKLKELFCKPSN
jgi:hypothetical protein